MAQQPIRKLDIEPEALKPFIDRGTISANDVLRLVLPEQTHMDFLKTIHVEKLSALKTPIQLRTEDLLPQQFARYSMEVAGHKPASVIINSQYLKTDFPALKLLHEVVGHHMDFTNGDARKRAIFVESTFMKSCNEQGVPTNDIKNIINMHYGPDMGKIFLKNNLRLEARLIQDFNASITTQISEENQARTHATHAYYASLTEMIPAMTEIIFSAAAIAGKLPTTKTDLYAAMIANGAPTFGSICKEMRENKSEKINQFFDIKTPHAFGVIRNNITNHNKNIPAFSEILRDESREQKLTNEQKEIFWRQAIPAIAKEALKVIGVKPEILAGYFQENKSDANLENLSQQLKTPSKHIDTKPHNNTARDKDK